jgi:transcription initiation factor TFIID subunit 6
MLGRTQKVLISNFPSHFLCTYFSDHFCLDMSVAVELRRDSMKAIGQSVGATLSDATADAIAAIVEKRMNDLIQDARKFMRHSYRSTLCAADINAALRLRNMESVVGYSSSNPLAFQHISVQSASNEQSEFCYLDDPAIQLDSYLAQPLLDAGRKAPCDPNFSIHWLAIDGVQPRIPMNPLHEIGIFLLLVTVLFPFSKFTFELFSFISDVSETELTSLADRELNSNSASGDAPAKRRRVTSVLAPDSESAGADATSSAAVIPLTKHLLSKEQQLYLENICSVLRAASTIDNFSLVANAVLPPAVKEARTLQRTVLKSLSTDAGIQPLVPFLVRFVAEEVSSNLTALPRLHAALRVAEALLSSPHAFLEPYLHQLVPAIMTCVVGRRLCEHPDEDHWSLRQRAARLLAGTAQLNPISCFAC